MKQMGKKRVSGTVEDKKVSPTMILVLVGAEWRVAHEMADSWF